MSHPTPPRPSTPPDDESESEAALASPRLVFPPTPVRSLPTPQQARVHELQELPLNLLGQQPPGVVQPRGAGDGVTSLWKWGGALWTRVKVLWTRVEVWWDYWGLTVAQVPLVFAAWWDLPRTFDPSQAFGRLIATFLLVVIGILTTATHVTGSKLRNLMLLMFAIAGYIGWKAKEEMQEAERVSNMG